MNASPVPLQLSGCKYQYVKQTKLGYTSENVLMHCHSESKVARVNIVFSACLQIRRLPCYRPFDLWCLRLIYILHRT